MAKCGEIAALMAAVQIRCSRAGSGQITQQDHEALLAEVRALAKCIDCMRDELAVLDCNDMLAREVPAAADELDAIVAHTAAATGTILDECERLEAALAGTPSAPLVRAAASRIYEACSFQDITGQRVAKVVLTLQLLEFKLGGILGVFGHSPDWSAATLPPQLLNGPQLLQQAMGQADVDALLDSFE